MDAGVVEWAKRVPVDQIPGVLVFLSARLVAEGSAGRGNERTAVRESHPEKLLTAGELAQRLNLPESWVRNEERAGQIPGVRAGKYVRFKLSEVEKALADRKRQRA